VSPHDGSRYHFGGKIGGGYFGDVYECHDDWGNDLAAKVLQPRKQSYDEVRATWLRETANLVSLRHPNITYVHDAFEYSNTFYFIIERCSFTIENLLTAGIHGASMVPHVARGLLQAVGYMHRANYVHKDIHPGNVFVKATEDALGLPKSPVYSIKVGDLGIANLEPDIDVMNTLLAQWMLPPESLRPDLYGPRVGFHTDIYHAGLLLLAVLRGHVEPFDTAAILSGVPRQRAEALGPPYGPAIAQALRRTVHARHATAYEFWRALGGTPP